MSFTEIMDARSAATYLDIKRGLLYKLTSQHRIPFYRPVGKKIFFRKSELDQWLNAGRVPTDEELKGGIKC